ATMTVALLFAAGAGTASAQTGIGGQLFATGGTVEIDVRPASAAFVTELFLQNEDGTRGPTLALNTEVGRHVEIGPFPAGRELVFGIFVRSTGQTFLMGPGSRNPDGIAHAQVTQVAERVFDVGFEDQLGGGDRDYNDNVFRFTGNLAPNQPPVANDRSLTTPEDTPLGVGLTGSDPEGGPLTFAVATPPAHGTLSGTAPSLTYTPAANFTGTDSFTFTVTDADGAVDTGTVSITVAPLNDPPVAADQSLTTPEDTPRALTLTGSDIDGDALTFTAAAPSHGTLSGSGATLVYTPAANFNGTDSFTFVVDDGHGGTDTGTVTITVTAVNDPPVANDDARTIDENDEVTIAVLANDSDADGDALIAALVSGPAHGTATCSATECVYRPVSNFVGTDTFRYRACDPSGACDEATVTITVRGIGKPGRLTGGGWLRTDDGKSHHQVHLACTAAEGGTLRIDAPAGRFVLEHVDFALCVDDPALDSGGPRAGWEIHRGSGTGSFNGAGGYTIEWVLTDEGEPGRSDGWSIVVRDPVGRIVLSEDGSLDGGNHQAHAG
ncbi:MAG TPA: Ig-like domain-containing protein, partial [Solirubrobacteraceae bacterium]|nr:Ig-like domain-containing protein [Solirubrobacteraceae bacterium]